MHSTLMLVNEELTQLVASLKAIGSNEPFNVAHGAWNLPGTTRDELVEPVERLLLLIADRGTDQLTSSEELIADYPRRLNFLRANTVPHLWGGNAIHAIPAFMITIQALKEALEKALPKSPNLAEAM